MKSEKCISILMQFQRGWTNELVAQNQIWFGSFQINDYECCRSFFFSFLILVQWWYDIEQTEVKVWLRIKNHCKSVESLNELKLSTTFGFHFDIYVRTLNSSNNLSKHLMKLRRSSKFIKIINDVWFFNLALNDVCNVTYVLLTNFSVFFRSLCLER